MKIRYLQICDKTKDLHEHLTFRANAVSELKKQQCVQKHIGLRRTVSQYRKGHMIILNQTGAGGTPLEYMIYWYLVSRYDATGFLCKKGPAETWE